MREVKATRPLTNKQRSYFKPCKSCGHEYYSKLGQPICQVCVSEINREIVQRLEQSA